VEQIVAKNKEIRHARLLEVSALDGRKQGRKRKVMNI